MYLGGQESETPGVNATAGVIDYGIMVFLRETNCLDADRRGAHEISSFWRVVCLGECAYVNKYLNLLGEQRSKGAQ